MCLFFFFFNDTATTEIYTLSLHDALPIFGSLLAVKSVLQLISTSAADLPSGEAAPAIRPSDAARSVSEAFRSEEHTSELQSQSKLVCRLLLEKKKNNQIRTVIPLTDRNCH